MSGGYSEEIFGAEVFAFQNKIVLFFPEKMKLTIFDDQLVAINTVIFKYPPLKIRVASLIDSGVPECIDVFNNKQPIPILENLQDSESYNMLLEKYSKFFRFPMPF
jgi:hypothetical protein